MIRILLRLDRDYWVAQCLEEDIQVFDLELEVALAKWRKVKLAEDYFLQKYGGFSVSPAPKHIVERFETAKSFQIHLPDLNISVGDRYFSYPASDLIIRIIEDR